jgi:PAS domain-containing protein
LLPPGEKARVLALHRRYLKAGGELKGEVDVVRSDGTAGRVLAESVRLQGDEGRPLRLVYVVDITERRQSELSLKSQRQFLQSVLDGMGAEICVVDERGVIVKVNHAWRKFGLRNGGADGSAGVGTDYLQVCERAAGSRDATASVAAHFAELQRTVLNGQRTTSSWVPLPRPSSAALVRGRVSRIESRPARIVITHDDVSASSGPRSPA